MKTIWNHMNKYGYGSKLGTPKLWMVNTKLDIHICGPINGLPFWPTSIWKHRSEFPFIALLIASQSEHLKIGKNQKNATLRADSSLKDKQVYKDKQLWYIR